MRARLLLLLPLLASPAVRAGQLALVRAGKPAARIVLPADADAKETLAADELQLYVKKISGAELPIGRDAHSPGAKVFIGLRDASIRRKLRIDTLKWDGFVMARQGDALVLAGNWPVGTLNAVYAFLEDEYGVRWYMPTEFGENVPKAATLSVGDLDKRVEPRFACRRNHGIDMSIRGDGKAWARRVRITSHDLDVPFNRYSHNLYAVLPVDRYAAAHPEYYPMLKGERYIAEGRAKSSHWQPCTINPEVVGITVSAGRAWLTARPHTNFFSVGMNDSGRFCECAQCRALDVPGETFRNRPMVSDRYFTFVKKVADAIGKTHPGRYVSCIAYSRVESLPTYTTLPHNVYVVITQDVAQWFDPAYRKTDEDFAAAWAKAAGAFGTYDYTGLTWLLPRVYPHLMAESLKFYGRVGAVAATNEAYPTWWYAGPQLYLRAKLMWDPALDPDAVLDAYYRGFFGPAAQPMKRLYGVMERCMTKPRAGRWFEGLGSVIQQLDLWTPADLAECRQALAQAAKLARGQSRYRARVEFVARGLGFVGQVMEEYWQAQHVERLAGQAATSNETMLAETLKLLGMTKAREETWRRIRDDRLLCGIYKAIDERFHRRWASWETYLRKCASVGMAGVVSVRGELEPARVRRLLALVREGELADELRGLLWAAEHPDAPNLFRNAGFEQVAAQGPAPKGLDWVAADCPPGWSKWALKPATRPRLTWEKSGGRGGGKCVRLRGAKNACFIQTLRAKPGERYYCSAFVRTAGGADAYAQLRVQWKDADGKWQWGASPRIAQVAGGLSGWRQLSLVFTVPKGVAQAVVLLAAFEQQPGDSAWFDDARVVRLAK